MFDDDDFLEFEEPAPARRIRPKRGLTVRMLAAKTQWLAGLLYWREDRVWWKAGEQLVHPEPSDLAQTERTLNRIRSYPRATDLTFGDGQAWLARRCELLQLAKALSPLRCSDLASLAQQARDRDAEAIGSLCRLLRAEAHCVNPLPSAPSSALVRAGRAALVPLQTMISNTGESAETRVLAALVLGALKPDAEPAHSSGGAWLHRVWEWGRAQGLPEHPSLVSRLLRHPEGRDLAFRCESTLSQEGAVAGSESLRAWLASGVPETAVVELAEALDGARPIWERLRNWRPLLPVAPSKKRHQLATWCQETAEELELKFRPALLRIAEVTHSPAAVSSALDTLSWLLPDTTPSLAWGDEALTPVRAAVKLPRENAVAWLALLQRHRNTLWPEYESLRNNPEEPRDKAHLHVQRPWCDHGLPLFRFLERTGDPALAEEALLLGVSSWLGRLEEDSLETYRAAFAVIRGVGAHRNAFEFSSVYRVVRQFRDPAEARRALRPLIDAVRAAPEDCRAALFLSLTEGLNEPGGRSRLRRLPGYFDLILRERPEASDWDVADGIACVLVSLDQTLGEATAAIAEKVVRGAVALARENPDHHHGVWRMTSALEIACGLREPDELPDLALAQVAVRHDIPSWKSGRDEGLKLLARLPAFRRALRQAFPAQPHRCTSLIEKLGLAGKLSVEAREPLRALEVEPPPLPQGSAWFDLLAFAPELEEQVRAFVRNRLLLGEGADLTPSLRQLLRRPDKLQRELTYLESRPDLLARPAIQARCDSLRGQLERWSGAHSPLAAEFRDHFANLAVETVLAAAEHRVGECYRRSLALTLGALVERVVLDEDWLNAALLASTIDTNRLLLRRMLRAEAEGNANWREKHPVNARFLQGLAARGVDVRTWLSSRTRSAACGSVKGKKVRLHLEQRPLRILQMGNYFDTCLSADGCNAFSTVANACELNKRVVYVTDARGRVVARKLIGLNEQGDLIGYTTYTNVDTTQERTELYRIVRAYIEDFAAACGLTLSNEGTVPKLFAQAWYDDGRRDWGDDDTVPGKDQAHASRAAPMFARFSSRSSP